jgi:hypothetical protein
MVEQRGKQEASYVIDNWLRCATKWWTLKYPRRTEGMSYN